MRGLSEERTKENHKVFVDIALNFDFLVKSGILLMMIRKISAIYAKFKLHCIDHYLHRCHRV